MEQVQSAEQHQFEPGMFTIDSQRLDIEWERQSAACFETGSLAAKARLRVEDLKRQLDVCRASANTSIRRNPGQYGFATKPTESAIEAAITLLPEVQELQDKVAQARYQFDLCNAAVSALENKKKGLESLTQLRAMNYYSAK